MTDTPQDFTAEQAAAANTALRAALGLPPERFGLRQFVGMMSDEIEQLRGVGRTDEAIADLLRERVGVDVPAEAISRYYAEPDLRRR